MAYSLPDKPSIAVLPLTNLSDDPEQTYFPHDMTKDLITDLSKLSGLFLIARNSAFTYKDKVVNVTRVPEELGVRYVLERSVRRAGDKLLSARPHGAVEAAGRRLLDPLDMNELLAGPFVTPRLNRTDVFGRNWVIAPHQ